MKSLLKRLIYILLIAEIAYLLVVNLALNLSLTQSLINQHRPEKYAVYWERAWSWYPLTVHARGISANGQTSSQQWQAGADAATASIALLPLLQRTLRFYGADAENVDFHLRPRPKPDKDYAAIREFFPPIRDRDPNSPAVARAPRKPGKAWTIVVDAAHAHGSHSFWIFQIRGTVAGDIYADVSQQTRGGPLAVSNGKADIKLDSLTLNRDWEVSSKGSLQGEFAIDSFVPREHRGLKALAFLSLDAAIDAPVDSLDFLDFYLRDVNGLEIDGKGKLAGRLNYAKGDLLAGSDLAIAASELALSANPYTAEGAGSINIAVSADAPETLGTVIEFERLNAFHQDNQKPMLSGEHLQVLAQGPPRILPDAGKKPGTRGGRVVVTVPNLAVPDLQAYQRFIPDKWPFRLSGGSGELTGRAELSADTLSVDLNLTSDAADVSFKDYRFQTNLDTGLKVRGGSSQTASIDFSETYLYLLDARLQHKQKESSKPWQAKLSVGKGLLEMGLPDSAKEEASFADLLTVLKEQELKTLLASANATLDADASVSDLSWVNLLFKNPFKLAVSGAGEIIARMKVNFGWLDKGTVLQIQPRDLRIGVLDYVVEGDGAVEVAVTQGGEHPDMRLDAEVSKASLRRRGEKKSVIEQVNLGLTAQAKRITLGNSDDAGNGASVSALDLRIPSAKVTDMSVYNQYLPPGSPLKLLAGEAALTAEIKLQPQAADGFIKLQTSGLQSRLDEQKISGQLTLDIDLQDGVPQEMNFDISGSSLSLTGFKVAGDQTSFDKPGWRADLTLDKANVVWKKPLRLNVDAGIQMNDSRPIVAVFSNHRGKHGWLEKLLTVEDIIGKVRISLKSDRLLVPYAVAGSDKIDVGVKGLVEADHREAIFYARYKKLKGILKTKNGEQNFDIIGAEKKFKAYAPGKEPLALRSGLLAGSDNSDGEAAHEKTESTAKPVAASAAKPEKKKNPLTILKDSLSNFKKKSAE